VSSNFTMVQYLVHQSFIYIVIFDLSFSCRYPPFTPGSMNTSRKLSR
jgi:hypothetical protein